MIERHRGIPTTTKPKFEGEARTIRNRLGQLSISLPRIDDRKRWAGYPGLAGSARQIAAMIPFCRTYVEPFAGTAKVYQELRRLKKDYPKSSILNDKSEFIYSWLKQTFTKVTVTNNDFASCMWYNDSFETFYLIDPPWFKTYYDQVFSCFDRESIKSYDEEIIQICKKLKGKFIITTRKENQVMLNSGFKNEYVQSEYVVSGKYPQVLVTHNL